MAGAKKRPGALLEACQKEGQAGRKRATEDSPIQRQCTTDKRRRSPDGQVIYISSDSGASADAHQSADDSRLPAPIDDSQSEDSSYSGSCFLGSPLHHPHSLQEADAAAARSEADYLLQRLSMAQKLAKHEVQQSETSAEDTPCIPTRVKLTGSPMYTVQRRLGKGGYGYVYEGIRTQANRKSYQDKPLHVAVKFELASNNDPPDEWSVYRALQGCHGLPKLYYAGRFGVWNVMIMELGGSSLYDVTASWPGPDDIKGGGLLPDRWLAAFAVEAITILQGIHAQGFVHGDVKPENFVVKCEPLCVPRPEDACFEQKPARLMLLDLGLSQPFRYSASNQRHPYCCEPDQFRGTGRYASLHAHLGRTAAPRDDLESLVYSLAFLVYKALPWQGHKGNSLEKRQKVGIEKSHTSPHLLCRPFQHSNLAAPLERLAQAVFDLPFAARPDYDAYRDMFYDIAFPPGSPPILECSPIQDDGDSSDDDEADEDESSGSLQPRPKPPYRQQRQGVGANQHIVVFDEVWNFQQVIPDLTTLQQLQAEMAPHMTETGYRITSTVGGPDGTFTAIISNNPGGWKVQDSGIYSEFPSKSFIEQGWSRNLCITSIAGLPSEHKCMVVMSSGTDYHRQSYKVADSLPFDWIRKKWDIGFKVVTAACCMGTWCVVMALTDLYSEQVVETDYQYPSEAIHLRWNEGYRITSVASTQHQTAVIMSRYKSRLLHNQETLRRQEWPTTDLTNRFTRGFAITCMSYGRSQH